MLQTKRFQWLSIPFVLTLPFAAMAQPVSPSPYTYALPPTTYFADGNNNQQPLSAVTNFAPSRGPSIFIGGISQTNALANASQIQNVLASGKIGLSVYPLAVNNSWGSTATKAITKLFNTYGQNTLALPGPQSISTTELTIQNTSASAVTLPLYSRFTDTAGKNWDYVPSGATLPFSKATQTCLDPASGNAILIANSTCTITVKSELLGAITLAQNAITLSSVASITPVSNLAIVSNTQPSTTNGLVGSTVISGTSFADNFILGASQALPYETSLGVTPVMVTATVDNTTGDLPVQSSQWQQWVNELRAKTTIKVIAPTIQPPSWISVGLYNANFATDPFMDQFRQQALYGGGLSIDVSPTMLNQQSPAYLAYLETAIAWARANSLEVIWIITPSSSQPTTFYNDVVAISSKLKVDGMLPTRWIVATETINADLSQDCLTDGIGNDQTKTSTTVVCGSQNNGTATSFSYQNSLNNVALYLAEVVGVNPTPVGNEFLTGTSTLIPSMMMSAHNYPVNNARLSSGDLQDGYTLLHAQNIGHGIASTDQNGVVQAVNGLSVANIMSLWSSTNSVNFGSSDAFFLDSSGVLHIAANSGSTTVPLMALSPSGVLSGLTELDATRMVASTMVRGTTSHYEDQYQLMGEQTVAVNGVMTLTTNNQPETATNTSRSLQNNSTASSLVFKGLLSCAGNPATDAALWNLQVMAYYNTTTQAYVVDYSNAEPVFSKGLGSSWQPGVTISTLSNGPLFQITNSGSAALLLNCSADITMMEKSN